MLSREFYIPKGSIKVSDKQSDAIAYIYNNASGRPAACLFLGKQAKPVSQYYYSSEAKREESITKAFENYRAHKARVAENRKSPSSMAVRNRAIKDLLESRYGKGNVKVTGNRGTAYGWVDVEIKAPWPEGYHSNASATVTKMLLDAGIHIGRYDSADYGSGYEIHVSFTS